MTWVDLKRVRKDIDKLPLYIVIKLQKWAEQIEMIGLREVRKHPGYHDEPLYGERNGQSSIRLSRSYRAIYIERVDRNIELVVVIEVCNHKY